MKKERAIVVLLCVSLLTAILAGCGSLSLNLGNEDARMKAYVQGYLDLTYKGQFNQDFLKEMDMTEEEAQEQYEKGLQAEVEFFQTIASIEFPTEEQTQKLMDLYREIYKHSEYTVVSASKLGSGNYAVEVSLRPIDIMTKITQDDLVQIFTQAMAEFGITEDAQLDHISEADYKKVDEQYTQKVLEKIEAQIPNLGHGEEKNFIVQIKDEGDTWGPAQKDLDNIDLAMIDYTTLDS